MKSRRLKRILLGALAVMALCAAGYLLVDRDRPAPVPLKRKPYDGVEYRRVVQYIPHPVIAHVVVIDTKHKGIQFLVTPSNPKDGHPLQARTTSQFLEEFDLQIAINGDGFTPWWSRGPADYYPHEGDPVTPLGFSASRGDVYSMGITRDAGEGPTLYISRRNAMSFNNAPGNIFNAISGDRMLVSKGEPVSGLNDTQLHPRTAIGLNRNGRYLYLVVVDGRQPFYSEGMTFAGLAGLLIKQGVYIAMSMDGGGSSTMVMEGADGAPEFLNSPIDLYLPGRERPVANHLGVYIK
jgi:hypothetical protein